jgi:hypothetical protein
MGFLAQSSNSSDRWVFKDICASIMLCALCFYIVGVACLIAVENHFAGDRLPRDQQDRDSKWRVVASAFEGKMSSNEKRRLHWERRLRDAVATHGLAQYTVCPIAILVGAAWTLQTQSRSIFRAMGSLSVIAGTFGLVVAFWLGYWSSLGW